MRHAAQHAVEKFLGDSLASRLFGRGPDAFRIIIPASMFRTLYSRRYVNHLMVRPRDVERALRIRDLVEQI